MNSLERKNKLIPGPGQYNLNQAFKSTETSKICTLKPKLAQITQGQTLTPGPGQYTPRDDFDGKGEYYQSKYAGSGAAKFSPLNGRNTL